MSGDRGPVTNVMCDGGAGKRGLEFGGPPVPCADAPRVVWGQSDPAWLVNLSQTLTFFENWRASVNIDAMGGHWMAHDYAAARYTSHPSAQLVHLQDDPIGMGYISVTRNGFAYAKAGFAKLREVALSYNFPSSLAEKVGASSASFRVGARNVARLWIAQDCNDPGGPSLGESSCEPMGDPEMTRKPGRGLRFRW